MLQKRVHCYGNWESSPWTVDTASLQILAGQWTSEKKGMRASPEGWQTWLHWLLSVPILVSVWHTVDIFMWCTHSWHLYPELCGACIMIQKSWSFSFAIASCASLALIWWPVSYQWYLHFWIKGLKPSNNGNSLYTQSPNNFTFQCLYTTKYINERN